MPTSIISELSGDEGKSSGARRPQYRQEVRGALSDELAVVERALAFARMVVLLGESVPEA